MLCHWTSVMRTENIDNKMDGMPIGERMVASQNKRLDISNYWQVFSNLLQVFSNLLQVFFNFRQVFSKLLLLFRFRLVLLSYRIKIYNNSYTIIK